MGDRESIQVWRNIANEGRGSAMTQALHDACDRISGLVDALEGAQWMPVKDAKKKSGLKLFFAWADNEADEFQYALGHYEPDAMPWATHVLYLTPPEA